MLRWGDIKDQIKSSAATSGCDEVEARLITDEACKLLTDAMVCVGSAATIKISTFVPSFSLPYNFERALEVSQCDPVSGDLEQGWFNITNASTYVDPSQTADGSIIDLGMLPYEQRLLGPAYIGVRADYNEEATVEVWGMMGNDRVMTGSSDGDVDDHFTFKIEKRDSPYDQRQIQWSDRVVTEIADIRKTVTSGQVRVLAKDKESGKIYVVVIAQPEEKVVERRHYKFPALNIGELVIESVSIGESFGVPYIALHTKHESLNVKPGQSVWLSGWNPSSINGLWTISQVVEGTVYVNNSYFPIVQDSQVQCVGRARVRQCLSVSALWRRLPISSDNSVIPMRNLTALKMGVKALSKLWADDLQGYTGLFETAVKGLQAESSRYGQDPIHQMERKAQYQWDVDNYPTAALAYIRARIALEITGGLLIGKEDLTRLINEVMEYIINSAEYGKTVLNRDYVVEPCGRITCDPDVQSILTASINGHKPLDIKDRFFATTREYNCFVSPFVGYANTSAAGQYNFQSPTIPMIDGGEMPAGDDCCNPRRVYWLHCGLAGCRIVTVAKARYVPLRNPSDVAIITFYGAIKLMAEAFIARSKSDIPTFRVLEGQALKMLDREMGEVRGGAQGTMRTQNSNQVPRGRRR